MAQIRERGAGRSFVLRAIGVPAYAERGNGRKQKKHMILYPYDLESDQKFEKMIFM